MSQAIITKLAEILKQLGGAGSTTSAAPTSIDKITRVLTFSTTTPLAAAGVYTSPTIDAINYKVITFLITSDVAGSYFIQYSDDGVTWYNSSTTATSNAANAVSSGTNNVILRYYRLVYTNGAAIQGTFKAGMYISPL